MQNTLFGYVAPKRYEIKHDLLGLYTPTEACVLNRDGALIILEYVM